MYVSNQLSNNAAGDCEASSQLWVRSGRQVVLNFQTLMKRMRGLDLVTATTMTRASHPFPLTAGRTPGMIVMHLSLRRYPLIALNTPCTLHNPRSPHFTLSIDCFLSWNSSHTKVWLGVRWLTQRLCVQPVTQFVGHPWLMPHVKYLSGSLQLSSGVGYNNAL